MEKQQNKSGNIKSKIMNNERSFITQEMDKNMNIDRHFKREYRQEKLRQARQSHNLAMFVNGLSAIVILFGVGLVYLNKLPEATVATTGGVFTSMSCLQLAKEKSEELQEMIEDLEDES
ncbi:MAG: hypothetical protein WBA93_23280 [Microcoleaceae cyanobacterium]